MIVPSEDSTVAPAMTPQQARLTGKAGFALYRDYAVGSASLMRFAYYELSTLLLTGLPGLIGYGLRSLFFPALFKDCGARPALGRGLVLRNLTNVTVGKKLLLDDYAVIDVRGSDGAITLGDFVSVGRFSTLVAKSGKIHLANGVNIGSHCRVATQSLVEIGESTLVAAYCYIGPGNHQQSDPGKPLISHEMDVKGGVKIGAHCWIGARATILDGVTIGEGSIIGAHSLVTESVPPYSIAIGTPARVVKQREGVATSSQQVVSPHGNQ